MPSDEGKLQKQAARALRAKQLMDNEILTGAFVDLEQAYIERWRTTNVNDSDGREKLFVAVNVIGKVKEHIAAVVADGNVAQVELNDLAKASEIKTHF